MGNLACEWTTTRRGLRVEIDGSARKEILEGRTESEMGGDDALVEG